MSAGTPVAETGAPAALAEFARDFYHCADCNYCVDATWAERGIDHVCPTIVHHQPVASYSGRGFLVAARAWYEGAALDEAALAARVFACTGCGNCEALCPIGLRPAQIGQTLRETLAARDQLPPAVARLRANMRTHGNPDGRPAATRVDWARDLDFVTHEASVLYAPGCAAALRAPQEAAAAVRLLQAAGERVAFRGTADRCCGAPLREAGLGDDALQAEARLAGGVQATRVVTSGLECMPAWRRAVGVQAVAFGDWVLDALRAARLTVDVPADLRVFVFDGCAGRRPGESKVGDPLREILACLRLQPVNDALGAAHAVCCGAAGTMSALAPASAQRMAEARLVDRARADVILASDPRCAAHLAAASGADSALVRGLAEFLLTYARVSA